LCWKQSRGYEFNKSDDAYLGLQQGFSTARLAWKDRIAAYEKSISDLKAGSNDEDSQLVQAQRLLASTRRRLNQVNTEKAELEETCTRAEEKCALLEALVVTLKKEARRTRAPIVPAATLQPDLLRDLIVLCHPDRNHHPKATEITAWLLAQRQEKR